MVVDFFVVVVKNNIQFSYQNYDVLLVLWYNKHIREEVKIMLNIKNLRLILIHLNLLKINNNHTN